MSIYDHQLNALDGTPLDLHDFEDKAAPRRERRLQVRPHPPVRGAREDPRAVRRRGFSVLGVPCNQFLGQEPGTAEEIATFCSTTYGVTFPMAEKVEVNGDGRHPLYEELTAVPDARGQGRRRGRGTSRSSSSPPAARSPGSGPRSSRRTPRSSRPSRARCPVDPGPSTAPMRGRRRATDTLVRTHERYLTPPPRPPRPTPPPPSKPSASPPSLVTALAGARASTSPFAIQRLTIADALAGRDVCGKAKTGSGKTLAFGLPLLQRLEPAEPRKPRGLVLVPTRELALQVHDVLAPLAEAVGSRVVAVYGGADMDKQIKALTDGVEAIIATPGRLIDLVERKEVELDGLEIVVVDEADRMADMGFLPQVEWLLRHVDSQHQTLLFSATLDGVVDGLIKRYQHDPVYHEVASPTVTVDAMVHRFIAVHEMDKVKVAAAIARGSGRALAFTNTKRVADRLARALNDEGVKAAAIHGDLRQGQREDALRDFTTARSRSSSPPTSPPAACTSTTSTWSSTTTPPRTTRPTSTAPAAPPAPAPRAWP